jgi:hypothetical protein
MIISLFIISDIFSYKSSHCVFYFLITYVAAILGPSCIEIVRFGCNYVQFFSVTYRGNGGMSGNADVACTSKSDGRTQRGWPFSNMKKAPAEASAQRYVDDVLSLLDIVGTILHRHTPAAQSLLDLLDGGARFTNAMLHNRRLVSAGELRTLLEVDV